MNVSFDPSKIDQSLKSDNLWQAFVLLFRHQNSLLTICFIGSEEEMQGLTEHVEREREKKKEREVAYYQSLREFKIHNSVESEESDSE